MIKFLRRHLNELGYAALAAMGLLFAAELSGNPNLGGPFLALGFSGMIYIAILVIIKNSGLKKLRQLGLLEAEKRFEANQYQQTILPIVFFLAANLFLYFNNTTIARSGVMLAALLINWLIFIEIKATFSGKSKLASDVNFVEQLALVFSSYFLINSLVNYANLYEFEFFTLAISVFAINSLHIAVNLVQEEYADIYTLLLSLFGGLILGYITAALHAAIFTNALLLAFFNTLLFYLVYLVIKHDLRRTLSINIIVEYVLVALISLFTLLLFR